MIAQKLHMRTPSKSSVIRLVSYLADKQGHEQRVHTSWTTNLESEDLQWAGIEMRAVQRMNVRSKADKTYHLVISFPTGETPNLDTLKSIENDVCTKLGYGEHHTSNSKKDFGNQLCWIVAFVNRKFLDHPINQ